MPELRKHRFRGESGVRAARVEAAAALGLSGSFGWHGAFDGVHRMMGAVAARRVSLGLRPSGRWSGVRLSMPLGCSWRGGGMDCSGSRPRPVTVYSQGLLVAPNVSEAESQRLAREILG